MDCVLTYHTNIRACGVAKFNLLLSQKLNIPLFQLFDPTATGYLSPCLSIKPSEFSAEDIPRITSLIDKWPSGQNFSLFLHDFLGAPWEEKLVRSARSVFSGSAELSKKIKSIRPEHKQLWAPPMLTDLRVHHDAEITLFSFGMAHKLQTRHYHTLRGLLQRTGKKYRIFLSTALHEGMSFDDSFEGAFKELEQIFPGQIYFLGYLSDSATFNCMQRSTFFAAFFSNGVRANNTSVHAAMEYGSVVITNLDGDSPEEYAHNKNILDINQLKVLPTDPQFLENIGQEAIKTSLRFSWSALLSEMVRYDASTQPLGGNKPYLT